MNSYQELQEHIADWLLREDLTNVIPGFIVLAEASINRRLRVRQMIASAEIEVEDRVQALPADWLESITADNDELRLQHLPMDEYPARILSTGEPTTYTVVGNNMHFSRLPEEATQVDLLYYARVPALSGTNTSNWLLDLWPDIYLYGSLMHSAPYLQDDPRLTVWATMFEKALAEAKLSDSLSYNGSRHQIRAE